MQSYKKYKKYKLKYLNMKKYMLQYGGDKPVLQNIERINRFRNGTEMEKFLNPIYGLYTCENGFIENNYRLYDAQRTDLDKKEILERLPKSRKIHGITHSVLGVLGPNNEIRKLQPRAIGRYIALLYFNDRFIINKDKQLVPKNKELKPQNKELKPITTDESKVNINFINIISSSAKYSKKLDNEVKECIIKRSDADIKILLFYINNVPLLKKHFSLTINNDMQDFHIILYCLWWTLDNDNGIDEYYKGIYEVFTICDKYISKSDKDILQCNEKVEEKNKLYNSFESILIKITTTEFNIYSYSKAHHFCNNIKPITYSDCGETTLRNFINLICFDGTKFDVMILAKYGAIKGLVDFYTKFNNFIKQSEPNNIYGPLNARDEWSKLIIENTNNVRMTQQCNEIDGKPPYRFEVETLMSEDGKTTNFFQLIKNLFKSVNNWNDFIKDHKYITRIDNNINMTGIGSITITRLKKQYKITCERGHYYMTLITPKDNNVETGHVVDVMQKEIISVLLNKNILTEHNCYYRKWSSESICDTINNNRTELNMRQRLLELSYMNMYDSDTRRRIKIDTRTELFRFFVEHIVKKYNGNDELKNNLNDYTFICVNVDFVNYIPSLKTLNCEFVDFNIPRIDLSPLRNIEHIGDNFLHGYPTEFNNITEIDLRPLENVRSIGNGFMVCFRNLVSINTVLLPHLKSIGDNFMAECEKIRNLELLDLINLETIGRYFLLGCYELETIKLSSASGLPNLQSIGGDFMAYCPKIQNIQLHNTCNLKTIGYNFMQECFELQNIEIPNLSKLESIEHSFAISCIKLTNIDLSSASKLSNLISIDRKFMYRCNELQYIRLLGLDNLKTIGMGFMSNCKKLIKIELTNVINLTTIVNDENKGSAFAQNCTNLEVIDLSSAIKLDFDSIKTFAENCPKVKILKPKLE